MTTPIAIKVKRKRKKKRENRVVDGLSGLQRRPAGETSAGLHNASTFKLRVDEMFHSCVPQSMLRFGNGSSSRRNSSDNRKKSSNIRETNRPKHELVDPTTALLLGLANAGPAAPVDTVSNRADDPSRHPKARQPRGIEEKKKIPPHRFRRPFYVFSGFPTKNN